MNKMIPIKDQYIKRKIYKNEVPLSFFKMLSFSLDKIQDTPEICLVYAEREGKEELKGLYDLITHTDLVEDTTDAYICLPSDLRTIYEEQVKKAEALFKLSSKEAKNKLKNFESAIADTIEINRYSLIGKKENKYIFINSQKNADTDYCFSKYYLILDVDSKTVSADFFFCEECPLNTPEEYKEWREEVKKKHDIFLSEVKFLKQKIDINKEKKDKLMSVRLTQSDFDTLIKLASKYNCNRNTMISYLIRNFADNE